MSVFLNQVSFTFKFENMFYNCIFLWLLNLPHLLVGILIGVETSFLQTKNVTRYTALSVRHRMPFDPLPPTGHLDLKNDFFKAGSMVG